MTITPPDKQLQSASPSDDRVRQMSDQLIYELTRAMSLHQRPGVGRLLRLLMGGQAERLARIAIGYDDEIGRAGLAAGGRWLVPHFVAGYDADGVERIPAEGPLLIVSNHPAALDGFLISSFVERRDFKVVVGEIPVWKYLPNFCSHAIWSPKAADTAGRMQTVRNAVRHLESGGALLTFPRGTIEPDPSFMADPDVDFGKWSRSLEIFLNRVPQTRVLVTMVSGVIAPQAARNILTWSRRGRGEKQRLAFMYQFIRQTITGKELYGLRPRVTFGELLSTATHGEVMPEIQRSALRTLQFHLSRLRALRPART